MSALHGTDHDAFDEVALEERIHQKNREGNHHGDRHAHAQCGLLGGDIGQGVRVLRIAHQSGQRGGFILILVEQELQYYI